MKQNAATLWKDLSPTVGPFEANIAGDWHRQYSHIAVSEKQVETSSALAAPIRLLTKPCRSYLLWLRLSSFPFSYDT